MTHRLLVGLAVVAALGACTSSSSSRDRSTYVEVWKEGERSPAKSAGWCELCNYQVYEGHRCRVTHPCGLCKREIGSRHIHEVVWTCTDHEIVMSTNHVCNDAKNCETCRRDRRSLLGPKPCERCAKQVPPVDVRGITTYCQTCNQEVGANHIHHKTNFCQVCLREAGSNHIHDATRLCMACETEHAIDHEHGTTEYCLKCHRDAGLGHKHGVTEWCTRCGVEMPWPHSHHD